MEPGALLPGTLDLLILKAVSLGPLHGYAVLLRLQQITAGALTIEQGAVYPALYRVEHQGLLEAEWGLSDNNRRARFYSLTDPIEIVGVVEDGKSRESLRIEPMSALRPE